MWKRKVSLVLLSLIIVLVVFGFFVVARPLPASLVQPSSIPDSTPFSKSTVNVAYLTNQSTIQKWEKYLTNNSSQTNLQNIVEFLSGLGTRHVSRQECNISADYIFTILSSYGYIPLRDYFTVIWENNSYITQNIYCVKPSLSPSEGIILLACHYDSIRTLRIGTWIYNLQNTGCPGAVDDATGVAVLLETARLLANVTLEKTLVLAFLSGEEGNSTTEHWFGSGQL
ncbi:MAG: M28 family peptidase, partial [Candidatus Jordarchaeaceae archaeon]